MSRKKFAELSPEERASVSAGIAELRESQNMTQDQLAEKAGVSRQAISNIERGGSVPSGKNLTAIMYALGVDEAPEFDMQIEKWLVMVGSLVEQIPERRRQKAMDATQQYLLLSVAADINNIALAASVDDFDEEAAANMELP